jgi:hypothetical protein
MMKEKAGITTVFLDSEERKIIADNGATLKGVVRLGIQVLTGNLQKINKLAEKLSEALQEKALVEEKLRKTMRELKTGGQTVLNTNNVSGR